MLGKLNMDEFAMVSEYGPRASARDESGAPPEF